LYAGAGSAKQCDLLTARGWRRWLSPDSHYAGGGCLERKKVDVNDGIAISRRTWMMPT
jgi:hypothetical protein